MNKKNRVCMDHKGRRFACKTAMLQHYGVDTSSFNGRLNRGWSLEKALTVPVKRHGVYDHIGKFYVSVTQMCYAYGIYTNLYYLRRKAGWSLEEILTTPSKPRKERS